MKNYILTALGVCLIQFMFSACERTTKQEAEENTEEIVVTGESKAEEELNEFRNWMRNRAVQADSNFNREWPEIKEDYKRQTQKLDSSVSRLSDKSRAEYQELKQEYRTWENRRERRLSMPLSTDTLAQMQQQLLGQYVVIDSVPAHQMKDVYVYFMRQVRSLRGGWTPGQWDYVNAIYRQLNRRKDQIDATIATSDRLKIAALQTEYLAFEAANDARDLGKEVRD